MGTVGFVLRKLHGLRPGLQAFLLKLELRAGWLTLRAASRRGHQHQRLGLSRCSLLHCQPPPSVAAGQELASLRIGGRGPQVAEGGQGGGSEGRSAAPRRMRSCPAAGLLQASGAGAAVERRLLGREVGGTARRGAPGLGIFREQWSSIAGPADPMTSLTVCQPQLRRGEKRCTHISALKPLLLVVEIVTKAQTSSQSFVRRWGGGAVRKGRGVAHWNIPEMLRSPPPPPPPPTTHL